MASNLADPIRRTARRLPGGTAVVEGPVAYSYRELWGAVCRTREALAHRGLRPGERVLVWLPNGLAFLAAHLGAMAGGLVSVPIKAENGPVEFAAAVADSGPRLLIADPERLARLPHGPPAGLEVLAAEELPLAGPDLDLPPAAVAEDHPASVIYSYFFGQGRAYGAVLSHRNHRFAARHCGRFHVIREGDRVYLVLPMLHVYAMGVAILPSFYQGATLYLGRSAAPRNLLRALTEHRITHLPAVPTLLELMRSYYDPEAHDLAAVHHLISGATFLPAEVHQAIAATLRAPLVQGWGLTECFPAVCNPPDGRNRPGTLGIADHPEIAYRVVDPEGRSLPAGEEGEIEIRSPGVMRGYFAAPEATARVLRGGWLRTGDLGWVDGEGYLRFARMLKPILNLAGNKVDPVEVGRVLGELPGVVTARVKTVTSGDGPLPEVLLAAEIETKPEARLSVEEVRGHCRKRLAAYKVPQVVEIAGVAP